MRGEKCNVLAFNIDNIMFKSKWEFNRPFSFFRADSYFDREIDGDFVRRVNLLWRKGFDVYLQTSYKDVKAVEEFIDNSTDFFYYSKIVPFRGARVVKERLNDRDYAYYIDEDINVLADINHEGAISYDEFLKLM